MGLVLPEAFNFSASASWMLQPVARANYQIHRIAQHIEHGCLSSGYPAGGPAGGDPRISSSLPTGIEGDQVFDPGPPCTGEFLTDLISLFSPSGAESLQNFEYPTLSRTSRRNDRHGTQDCAESDASSVLGTTSDCERIPHVSYVFRQKENTMVEEICLTCS